MANRLRRVAAVLLVLTVGAWLTGCSMPDMKKAKADAEASTDTASAEPPLDDSAKMIIDHTPGGVTVDNQIGRRLISIRIEIQVAENDMPYVYTAPTIEKGEKATFEFVRFKTDAADLLVDPSSVHPKQITVKAKDSFGRTHEATAPWTP